MVLKRLEFLKDIVPRLSRVALLVNPNTEVAPLYRRVTETSAAELGLELHHDQSSADARRTGALASWSARRSLPFRLSPPNLGRGKQPRSASLRRLVRRSDTCT
jgi:hypothetical protein